jgi:hypothetical protein
MGLGARLFFPRCWMKLLFCLEKNILRAYGTPVYRRLFGRSPASSGIRMAFSAYGTGILALFFTDSVCGHDNFNRKKVPQGRHGRIAYVLRIPAKYSFAELPAA